MLSFVKFIPVPSPVFVYYNLTLFAHLVYNRMVGECKNLMPRAVNAR